MPVLRKYFPATLATLLLAAGAALAAGGAGANPWVLLAVFLSVPPLTLLGGRTPGGALAALWLAGLALEPWLRAGMGQAPPAPEAYLNHLSAPLLAFGAGLAMRLIEDLARRIKAAREDARHANLELLSLRDALDFSHDGIVVLDNELRAQFANSAFRALFEIPLEMAQRKPSFAEIVEHGCRMKLYDVEEAHLEGFAEMRKAFVKYGTPVPVLLRMRGPKVIRFKCSQLAAGGRLLNYTDVTEFVADAERLEELANIDAMTGLFNRRHFLELSEQEWQRAARYQRPLSLLMIDIDLFKNVNDRFGHDAGDQALCHVAAICGDSKRTSDIVGRLGGEEFALLLPETALEGALVVAERIRSRVEANPLQIDGHRLELTVSIGAAEEVGGGEGLPSLLKRADTLLYAAKRAGRNRISLDIDLVGNRGAAA